MNAKKIIGAVTSAAMTAALLGGGMSEIKPIDDFISEVVVVSAAEANNTKLEADVLYVIVNEMGDDGKYCQWYRTNDQSFRKEGIEVKLNGKDISSETIMKFSQTPKQLYDGKNFDYEVPITIYYGESVVSTVVEAKIGKSGDANMDHVVDVRDAALIERDVNLRSKSKKGVMDDFGRFLTTGTRLSDPSYTTGGFSKIIADNLAKDALKRASGQKLEQKNEDSDYSLSLSKANGFPGETVSIQVVIDANDAFESLDALIEWDNETLASSAAVAVNGTLCSSYNEEGMVSIVDYGSGAIKDGAIANINFTIPENAVPGSQYEINFTSVETFTVISGGTSEDISESANISGTKIVVNKPKYSTTPAVTTTEPASETTVATTVSQVTETTVATTNILRGDANNDGVVNIRDAAFIARTLVNSNGKLEYSYAADYNDDGVVSIRDAAAIARFVVNSKK